MAKTILGLILAGVMLAGPASAQDPCFPRGDVAAALDEGYGERVVARGLSKDGAMVELFATPGGSTWTLIITTPGGNACPLEAGKVWNKVTPKAKKMGWRI